MEALGIDDKTMDLFLDRYVTAAAVALTDLRACGVCGRDIVRIRRFLDAQVAHDVKLKWDRGDNVILPASCRRFISDV